jgi:hypothetical protein
VALERLARRSFEGTAYESQAIGELHLLRCRENLSPISFTKLVSVILRVTYYVGNERRRTDSEAELLVGRCSARFNSTTIRLKNMSLVSRLRYHFD